MRARDAGNQAVLGARFPSIKRLKLHLVFLDARQNVIDEKTLMLGPSDAAVFTVSCPGRCGKGTFNFAGKLEEAAGAGLAFCEASAKCPESLYASSIESCGCEIKCRMDIDYFPASTAEKESAVTNG